jgi:hypothetical protein
MRLSIALLSLAAALLVACPATAARKKPQRTPRPPEHIACTRSGCHPTPPGCHPEIEFDPWGNPTGYDFIVCPGRR